MSDTPRTDAITLEDYINPEHEADDLAALAQTLERELTAEKERSERLEDALRFYASGRCYPCGWPLKQSVEDGCVGEWSLLVRRLLRECNLDIRKSVVTDQASLVVSSPSEKSMRSKEPKCNRRIGPRVGRTWCKKRASYIKHTGGKGTKRISRQYRCEGCMGAVADKTGWEKLGGYGGR